MLKSFLLVGLGSFVGGSSRYLTQYFVAKQLSSSFPFGTLAVNILGCFIIGVLFGMSEKTNFISSEIKLLLTTGFCGGFTTFSTFSLENISLLRDGQYFYVLLYVAVSVVVGFISTFIGIQLIKIL